MKTIKEISKGLMIAVGIVIAVSSLTTCKKQTTVIHEVEKPKEEQPDLQFKVKTDGSSVDVNVEGKVEDKK